MLTKGMNPVISNRVRIYFSLGAGHAWISYDRGMIPQVNTVQTQVIASTNKEIHNTLIQQMIISWY